MEQTLVLIKPDAVQRGLIGEIILRLERRGLRLVAGKFMNVSQQLARTHYAIHEGKGFYEGRRRLQPPGCLGFPGRGAIG